MVKVLLDTSTYIDIQRAAKNDQKPWAANTLRNLIAYRALHPQLTISAFTAYEILDGIYRRASEDEADRFIAQVLPKYEVLYPNESVISRAAQINASLGKGQTIGMADTLIAATAIIYQLPLVSANSRHFLRVQAAGFPITSADWREA